MTMIVPVVMGQEGDADISPGWIPRYEIVAYKISLTADPTRIPADGTSTSTITAQLQDRYGNDILVEDVTINFRTTGGTLSADSAVTDNDGTAIVTLTSKTTPQTENISAMSEGVKIIGLTFVRFEELIINSWKNISFIFTFPQ